MVETIIDTKISVPPSRALLVHRERLFQCLDSGLQHKLTVLSAPAGFGKTTLLSDWVGQQDLQLAWISLDEQDNDPGRFLTYLAHALQSAAPGLQIIEKIAALRQAQQSAPIDTVLAPMVNDLAEIQHPLAIILDDVHVITNQDVYAVLTFLVDRLPEQIHLILATRTDPALPLAKLRARGQLLEIDETDLRFNSDEIASFIQDVMSLDLAQEDYLVLEDRTEGWIAGLQLVALSLEGRGNATEFLASLSGTHRYILDYLVEEVIANLPQVLQGFLLRISPLARFNAELCDAVAGDLFQLDTQLELPSWGRNGGLSAKVFLEFLDDSNLFVFPLDYDRRWYRFHPLFSEFLQDRLAQHRPEDIPVIHRRAALWLSENNFFVEAIQHALCSGETELAADWIATQVSTTLARGEASTLMRWIDGLPAEVLSRRPDLQLALAWSLLLTDRLKLIERLQELLPLLMASLRTDRETILQRLQHSQEGSQERELLSEFTLLMAFLARDDGKLDRTIELFKVAAGALSKDDHYKRTFALAGLASTYARAGSLKLAERTFAESAESGRQSGSVYAFSAAKDWEATQQAQQGRLNQAEATYRTAINHLSDHGVEALPLTAHAYVGLADILLERNELEKALSLVEQGLERGRLVHDIDALREGYLIKARIQTARGDEAMIYEALGKGLDIAREISDLPCLEEAQAWQAILDIDRAEFASAARWASTRGFTDRQSVQSAHAIEKMAFGRLLLSEHKAPEAEAVFEDLLKELEEGEWLRMSIETLTLLSLAQNAAGKKEAAQRSLARALMLAEPERYVRTFIDKGPLMAAMLQTAAAQGHAPEYVKRLLEAFGEQLSSGVLLEPLSERELDVLNWMAAGLTNAQIADELVIAQSTVKTHINRIYSKLGVTRRTQAVVRARELHLM